MHEGMSARGLRELPGVVVRRLPMHVAGAHRPNSQQLGAAGGVPSTLTSDVRIA